MRMEYDIADTVHRSRFSVLELQSSALGFCVRGAHDVGRLISVSVASPSCEENGDADRTRGRTAAPVATAAGTYHTAHVPYVHRRRELSRDAPELTPRQSVRFQRAYSPMGRSRPGRSAALSTIEPCSTLLRAPLPSSRPSRASASAEDDQRAS